MTGAEAIQKERLRQIKEEGYSPIHDLKFKNGELLTAARCYAAQDVNQYTPCPLRWPFDKYWWKPSDNPIRNRVKAGALIAADIDRLQTEQETADNLD